MSITGVTGISPYSIQKSVGTQMLSNAIETQKDEGQAVSGMISRQQMENSIDPNVGSNFDVSV